MLIDDIISVFSDPRGYYKDTLHAIRSRKRGHLSIFKLICMSIRRREGGKGSNITKMFATKNYSHGPIFMHMARKILKLAFVLIFWIKLHLGEGLV